jgi:hypothetical protein
MKTIHLTELSMVNRLVEFRNPAMGATERRQEPGFPDCSCPYFLVDSTN